MNDRMMRDLMTYGLCAAETRTVSARRAQKLRKRGEDVRYVGLTKTGKARYGWMRRISPLTVYMPQREQQP